MRETMKDAILEVGVEHLPARFIAPALMQLSSRCIDKLRAERLKFKSVVSYGTLRRLTLVIEGVEEKSEALEKSVIGPSAKLLKDEDGRYTPQAAGFAKSQGIRPEELKIVSTPKGDCLQAERVITGAPAVKVLSRVFPALIEGIEFPKNMEWEESHLRFARPIRNLLALYGKKTIPFAIAGVRSCNKALGSAIGAKPIAISDPDDYIKRLHNACILVSVEERRNALSKALDQISRAGKIRIDKDADLMEETVYLTEHPVPVPGHFSKEFLSLPQALLTTVLKKQLKFLPVLDASGRLEPAFVGVRDGASLGQKEVQEGYERVLEARFNDARFFHERDLSSRLEAKLDRLEKVTFQKGLGSLFDKVERTTQLSIWLCGSLRRRDFDFDQSTVEQIARLAYADLVTEVVKEFPELQGVMGGHYARKDGEPDRVAMGIEEFYYPTTAKAPIPSHLEGAIASLAGKIDTLAALFSTGMRPSGSEDPFALRRTAMGIIRIILEKQLPVSLEDCVNQSLDLLSSLLANREFSANKNAVVREICEFLWQRAEAIFEDMGYKPDEIQSVEEQGLSDLTRTFKRLAAVHALRPNPEFATLAAVFKRAANILKQAGISNGLDHVINPTLITLEAESSLYQMMGSMEGAVVEKIRNQDFEGGLRRLVDLKPSVDHFFETVRVMDAEESVKQNRLALLAKLVQLFKSVADISRIQPAS